MSIWLRAFKSTCVRECLKSLRLREMLQPSLVCLSLLSLTGPFLVFLGPSGLIFFTLLGLTGPYLALLGLTGLYWVLLGLTRLFFAFDD